MSSAASGAARASAPLLGGSHMSVALLQRQNSQQPACMWYLRSVRQLAGVPAQSSKQAGAHSSTQCSIFETFM